MSYLCTTSRALGLLLILAAFLGFSASPAAHDQQPANPQKDQDVVKIHADLVSVLVTVTDFKDEFVRSLSKDDFQIYEDGILQEIRDFHDERDTPLSLAFLFDTSGSVRPRRDFERRAAARFFRDVFRAQDRGALLSVNTDVTVEQEMTSNVERLRDRAMSLEITKGATSLYDAVFLASDILRSATGRRAILILSDGRDTTSHLTFNEALRMAQEKDTVIFVVVSTGEVKSANIRDAGAEYAMRTFAEQTGGQAYFPVSVEDLDQIFARLAAALHAQYLLTYYSTNELRDGKFRSLEIKFKRPNFIPHARKGYYAPKDD